MEKDTRTWVYHKDLPEGKIMPTAEEAEKLFKQGWHRTPKALAESLKNEQKKKPAKKGK